MSIFGSISGFFSAIGRTGSDSHESGSISESLSESSSIQSVPDTQTSGSRRTSAVSPVGPPGSVILETPEVDLSHLSEEERAQIAAVIARAKTFQTLDDLTGVEPIRRPAGNEQPITDRLIACDGEYVTGNEQSEPVTAICRPPDEEATFGFDCGQPTCLSCCDGRFEVHNDSSSKTFLSAVLPSGALRDTGSEQATEPEAEVGEESASDKIQSTSPSYADPTTCPGGMDLTSIRGDCTTARCSSNPWDAAVRGESPTDLPLIEDSEVESPTQLGAAGSHRPRDLSLSNLSSLSSSTDSLADDTTSWSSDGVTGCRVPEPKSTSEPQLAGSVGGQPEEAVVLRAEPRCRSRSFDGSDRKRPSLAAKDRGGTGSHASAGGDRNQSPSRRSPKSPPRSPSWLRLRESPTRTGGGGGSGGGCHRTSRSPQVSPPSEKYPSKMLLDEPHHTGLPCPDDYRDYEAYLDDRRNPANGLETTEGGGDCDEDGGVSSLHLGNPFYSSSGYDAARENLDLASFAATVASGTAHLTSMSFSPPRPDDTPVVTAAVEVARISDDPPCLPVSMSFSAEEEKLDEPASSASGSVTEEVHSTENMDYPRLDSTADSPEDLLFLTSTLSVEGGWSRRFELSPIPDVSPSSAAEPEGPKRVPSHMLLRRTHSNEDQGAAGSYGGARCLAETSPTFGSFKRCPSYHNILALPELEKPESSLPVAKLSDQTVAIRDERGAQATAGLEAVPPLPKLPEEEQEEVADAEKREQTVVQAGHSSYLEENPQGAEIQLHRSQGLFVTVTDGTRRKNGSVGDDEVETAFIYGSFQVDSQRIGSSTGNVLTADVDEQVFLSDEELREIDLDEELPPKHLIVRRPRKNPPSTIRQPLSIESPTGETDVRPAGDETTFRSDRWTPDGCCSSVEDSGKDGTELPVRPGSRRKLPPVPLEDCDTHWASPLGYDGVKTSQGVAQYPNDTGGRSRAMGYHEEEETERVQEARTEKSEKSSGFAWDMSSTGSTYSAGGPGSKGHLTSRAIDEHSVYPVSGEPPEAPESPEAVRSSPMTKHRSKSNDEKTSTARDRNKTSDLKPRSVSADDRQTIIRHESSRQGIHPGQDDDDARSAPDGRLRQELQTVSAESNGVEHSVDESVVVMKTAYKENGSELGDPVLHEEPVSGIKVSGDGSKETDRTGGPQDSSMHGPLNPSSVGYSSGYGRTVDVTKKPLAAAALVEPRAVTGTASDRQLGIRLRPKVPPKPSRPQTDENGLAMVATVSLKHGRLVVPVSVHGLQQRVKDEIKIVTATRRLRLDEAEEIRILEAEFAERSKERRRLKAQKEAGLKEAGVKEAVLREVGLRGRIPGRDRGSWSDDEHHTERDLGKAGCCGRMEEMMNHEDPESRRPARTVVSTVAAGVPGSKQSKRPTSDPVFAKFSPIEEDGDAESVFLGKRSSDVGRPYASLDRQSGPPIRLGTAVLSGHKMLGENNQQVYNTQHLLSRSLPESSPHNHSLSTASLSSVDRRELSMTVLSDAEDYDAKGKEERLQYLQTEIEKRRKHLTEIAQRGGGGGLTTGVAVLTASVRESFFTKSDQLGRIHRDDASPPPDVISSRHVVSSGLIKPIDYQINPENYYVRSKIVPRPEGVIVQTGGEPGIASGSSMSVYSSYEYLTHKTESAHKVMTLTERVEDLFPSDLATAVYQGGAEYEEQIQFGAQPIEKDIIRYSESEDSLLYCPANYGSSRDSGVSSNMTGPDVYAFRSDRESTPPRDDFRTPAYCYPTSTGSCPTSSMLEFFRTREGPVTAATAAVGGTPAMPLLGDVTSRSRSLLRDIGSRPLSDDLEKYFQAEEPTSLLCRDDSDYSVTDSADDYIMEGGVTIRLNSDRKTQRSVTTPRKYPFLTKRILLTSDPKERSSRGFGVKIVGGQYLPWSGEQLCAYVAYIFPGSVADQIHGELQEGDQVLELNGESLTGKTNEEVNVILDSCNCEVELVVRHGFNLRTFRSITMSTINTDSNRSSYDNMPTASSFEESSIDGLDRVDPTRMTASNLRGHAPSSSASQQQQQPQRPYLGSDYLPQGTVPLQRASSATAEFKRKAAATRDDTNSPPDDCEKYVGEIQLQLSYDDYDGTLNVHIIQARNLRPKYKTGYCDPFVKVYLLPYRSRSECKRRTRCVPRTLNPEWHRTVVFLNIPQQDLATKTIDLSVWDHDRFMPNQFVGELLIDLSDASYLDNRPHWYSLIEDCDNRYGKRPRTGTMSSSDSAQSSSSSRSRKPERDGPTSGSGGLGLLGRREDPRGPEHRPILSESPSPYRYPGTRRTRSDSEESIAKRSCRYEDLGASSSRELASTVGQSGGSDQQLTAGVAQSASGGKQDPTEQRLTYTDESWTDCSERGLGFGRGQAHCEDRGQGLGCDRGQGLGCEGRSRNDENAFESRSKMAATLHCILTAIFCCLRSSASGSL